MGVFWALVDPIVETQAGTTVQRNYIFNFVDG
jgi:hypothetical protein